MEGFRSVTRYTVYENFLLITISIVSIKNMAFNRKMSLALEQIPLSEKLLKEGYFFRKTSTFTALNMFVIDFDVFQ